MICQSLKNMIKIKDMHETMDMITEIQKADAAMARSLLCASGITLTQLAIAAQETLENIGAQSEMLEKPMAILRKVLELGEAEYLRGRESIPFGALVERVMVSKSGRRERSIAETRQVFARVERMYPSFNGRMVCRITGEQCRQLIMSLYDTLSMQRKAYRILHHAFSYARKHGFCKSNPVDLVELPNLVEQRIPVLSLSQIKKLLLTALRPEHRPCAAAVGLMLWAGIRPYELSRLKWKDLHMDDCVINIEPQHAKTGGPRHVTIYPALLRWLTCIRPLCVPSGCIVPRSWMKRWRSLREAAGLNPWHEDALRHTFASYHAKYFGDFKQLQIDMGHSSSTLLRTRYLSMQGLTRKSVQDFWENIVYEVKEAHSHAASYEC